MKDQQTDRLGVADPARRELLKLSLLTVGFATTAVRGYPAAWFQNAATVVPFSDVPADFTTQRSSNPETVPGQKLASQDLRDLESWLTPIEDFYSVQHYPVPRVDAAQFQLTLSGLVGRPVTLSLDELKRRPKVERTVVFECGGNSRRRFHGMVGNATWAGVELKTLLEEARPATDAREVYFWGTDRGTERIRNAEYEQNFARSLPVGVASTADAILAYEMNGRPLPVIHGFPLRLVVPGYYGICNVKWLDRIEFAADRLMMRFMARDYVTIMGREVNGRTEWIETSVTKMRVKSVTARVTRSGSQFKVFGAAWSDGTPLKGVDVRVDGSEWQPATLDHQNNTFAWTFWSYETTGLSTGEHTVVSRATDQLGRTQPDNLDMKKTNWENNELFFRKFIVS